MVETKSKKSVKHKKVSKKKSKVNVWMIATIVIAVAWIITAVIGGSSTTSDVSEEDASEAVKGYIESNVPGADVLIETVEDVGQLYKVEIDLNGNKFESYLSKDGNLLFPSGIDLTENVTAVVEPKEKPEEKPVEKVDMTSILDDDAVEGDADAPVTIVEFSEFECPFCAKYYRETLSKIREEYVETGKVKIIFRDFPLSFHQNAQKAAEAAECAGEQDKYYEMHDKLFEDGVKGGVDSFKEYAKELGLDTEAFNECLDSDAMAEEVKKDMKDGAAVGVTGTPAFFVNGVMVSGAQPFANFKAVIDAALEE